MVLADVTLSIFGILMSWQHKKCKAVPFLLVTQQLVACVLFGIFLLWYGFFIPAGNDSNYLIL
jgi:vacuolar-type H+-ATPase subunit I/STV1